MAVLDWFSVNLYQLGIPVYFEKKTNHINIFISEIEAEIIFDWPTFKNICDCPHFV
jgi:hypothetical protein